jgi:hypothetical protein
MNMPKKSGKRSEKGPEVLMISPAEEQKKKARESVRKHDVAKLEIVGIAVKGIPSVRVSNHPVHEPVPTPTPTPPTPPPPPPPGK